MKDFIEKDASARRKKLPLSLNYTNDFQQQQNSSDPKNTVSIGRKFVCTSRIKDIEKNTFTIWKRGFHFKKNLKKSEKNSVHQQEYGSSLKFDLPKISVIFSISRKKLGIKKILFPVDKKLVFTSRNEELAKKYVPVEEKTASTGNS